MIRKIAEANVHPSQLPENRDRVSLHQTFNQVKSEIGAQFGYASNAEPAAGYERAWVIFLGTNISGKMHFACHIAEHFSTGRAYNCEDSSISGCPALLYGEAFHIPTAFMDTVRGQLPVHHQGKVPFQAAYAISLKETIRLLNGGPYIKTTNFVMWPMAPSGMQSLSFKYPNFPLEFWTHSSRAPVIFTALANERQKNPLNPEVIALFEQACNLETAFSTASDAVGALETNIGNKEAGINREERSQIEIYNNLQIPENRKIQVLKEKATKIASLRQEAAELALQLQAAQQAVLAASQAIDAFKKAHFLELPNSYREATFQIAFDTTLPDGSIVYKQYNGETGNFELSQNPDRAVRFDNAVHNPYLNLKG